MAAINQIRAMMGEVTTTSGTITTSITENTGNVAVGLSSTGKGDFVTAVSAEGAASAIKDDLSLATASYTAPSASNGNVVTAVSGGAITTSTGSLRS